MQLVNRLDAIPLNDSTSTLICVLYWSVRRGTMDIVKAEEFSWISRGNASHQITRDHTWFFTMWWSIVTGHWQMRDETSKPLLWRTHLYCYYWHLYSNIGGSNKYNIVQETYTTSPILNLGWIIQCCPLESQCIHYLKVCIGSQSVSAIQLICALVHIWFLQRVDAEVLELAIKHTMHGTAALTGTCYDCGITESQLRKVKAFWNIFFKGDESDCTTGTAILQVAALHMEKCKAESCLIAWAHYLACLWLLRLCLA